MAKPTVALVLGYLPNIDLPNKNAMSLGLPHRFAIVLDSQIDETGEMYFYWECWQTIAESLINIMGCDEAQCYEHNRIHSFDFKNGVSTKLSTLDDENEPTPYNEVYLFKEGETVCLIVTEEYIAIGGPKPYHDSYTFSFYVKSVDPSRIIETLSNNTTFGVREIIWGNNVAQMEPSGTSWITKVKDWLS
jgi:hypothetical protein